MEKRRLAGGEKMKEEEEGETDKGGLLLLA